MLALAAEEASLDEAVSEEEMPSSSSSCSKKDETGDSPVASLLTALSLEAAALEGPSASPPDKAEDGTEHDYEYVDDTSGVEAVSEDEPKLADSMSHARRNRYESKAAVAAAELKYRFRSRMLSGMA